MKLSSLLADIRIACPGMPEPWQYRYLTRSLQTFLSETQAWQEWSQYAWDFTNASGGIYTIPNALYNPTGPVDTAPYVRTDRVLKVKWVPTGYEVPKVTLSQLDEQYPMWMTETGKEPKCWAPYVSGFAGTTVPRVRFFPYPASAGDNTTGALKFLVSHTVIETETPDEVYAIESAAIHNGMADWLFRRYRETIVSGALARALMAPTGVDWSDHKLGQMYAAAFELGITKARSEVQAGQTTSVVTVTYGGY